MKTALIIFFNPTGKPDGYIDKVLTETFEAGYKADYLEVLPDYDAVGFKKSFERYKNTADNLIISGGALKFDLKELISEITESPLIENENARQIAEAVAKSKGEEFLSEYCMFPYEATLIPNVEGVYQGFMMDDKEFTLAVLPHEFSQFKAMCKQYVFPFFDNKYHGLRKKITLKYFGDKNLLLKVLEDAKEVSDGGYIYGINDVNGDITVNLFFEKYGEMHGNAVVRFIVSKLQDDIYAETDESLPERLFDILKLKKLKIATAESFTGGRIISEIIKNSGASEVVEEGIVAYANGSKQKRLGVVGADIMKNGAVSSIVAYQMAAGLLKTGRCDVAIATTGIAGPNSDDSAFPVGLCYIAVGMVDGVHTYKYKFNGNREDITERAKNTAMFLAIKKLKKV